LFLGQRSSYKKRDLGTKVHDPHPNDVTRAISRNKKSWFTLWTVGNGLD